MDDERTRLVCDVKADPMAPKFVAVSNELPSPSKVTGEYESVRFPTTVAVLLPVSKSTLTKLMAADEARIALNTCRAETVGPPMLTDTILPAAVTEGPAVPEFVNTT